MQTEIFRRLMQRISLRNGLSHSRPPCDEASRRSPVTWLPSAMSRESVLSEAERGATSYQMSRRGSGYLRFTLSYRDVEDLLAERGIRGVL